MGERDPPETLADPSVGGPVCGLSRLLEVEMVIDVIFNRCSKSNRPFKVFHNRVWPPFVFLMQAEIPGYPHPRTDLAPAVFLIKLQPGGGEGGKRSLKKSFGFLC